MLPDTKQNEYDLMENSARRMIKIDTLKGLPLVCNNSWDYKSDLNQVSFKTTTEVTMKHPMLKVEPMDLSPVTSKKIWKITVLRRPVSYMLNGHNSHKNRT